MKSEKICSVEECTKSRKRRGLCGMHHQRWTRYKNVHYITPEIERRKRSRLAQPKLGKAKPQTYLKYLGRHLHRVVAEQTLGRPLKKGEIVHHIDGNRHNNASENLQIISQSEHIREHRKEMSAARWSGPKKTHCPKGHEYSGSNLTINKKGGNVCRTCSRAAQKAWADAKRISKKIY